MKQYVFLSLLIIASALVFFTVKILSEMPDEKVKNFNASIKFEKEGNYKLALEELKKIYETNKKDYLVNLRLGWLYYMTADYEKSKTYYRLSSDLNKKSIEAKLGLAYPIAALGDWDQLKSLYADILTMDPANYTANLRLGQIYLNAEDYTNAEKYLQEVHQRYPGEYEPNLSLGWTYFYLGKKDLAGELFTNSLMLSPDDTSAVQGLDLVK